MQFGVWRTCRLLGRWLRRIVIVAAAFVIIALIWFNQIGLPDFLKNPLVEKLRDRGIELSFSRLRLRLTRGIVIENVRIGDVNLRNSPTLLLAELRLHFDYRALLRGRLQIDGLVLRQGRLICPLSPTNSIELRNIQSDLRFGTNDVWSLDNFHADFADAKLALSGDVAHPRDIRDWKIFHGQKTGAGKWREQLGQFYQKLARTHYEHPPQLTLAASGDADDPRSFVVKLDIALGETRMQLSGKENRAAQNYRWRFHGLLAPKILLPFLTSTKVIHFLDDFNFAGPLALDGDFYGNNFENITASGSASLANFTVHGVAVDRVAGDFSYTNRVLKFLKPHLANGSQTMTADEVILDFNNKLIWFKNGFSTADPESVARAIGPKVAKWLAPYHFFQPPTARVNGCAPMRKIENVEDVQDADLRFDILDGKGFRCLKIHAETITGTIHWLGQTLILTNVVAQGYGGSGNGSAFFDFSVPHEGADYYFTASVSKLNLHSLAMDWTSPSNHLEGLLSGEVTVTRADTRDWRSVNGFGRANLRNGLLWDIPVFGILSPLLNALVPGANLGSIRATDAGGKFTVTNGVIYSNPLEIHSTMMRLQYSGHVDLKGKVRADVTAQLLHDTPGIGPIISTIFWPVTELLKFKVSGTLKDPKVEPIYIPKEAMMLLHPFKTLQNLLPGVGSNTNSPPK